MAAKRVTRTDDIDEEVISKHNDLVYYLSVQIVEDDFQSLKDLFKDCPRAPKDLINIATVQELFVKLMNNENTSIGHYEYFTERLEKIHKSLASYMRREEQQIRDILNAGGPPVTDRSVATASHSQAVVRFNRPILKSESKCCIAIGNTGIIRCQILGEVGRVLWKKQKDADEHFNEIAIDNNKYIGGSVDSPTLLIMSVGEEDAGKYICQAVNSAGVAQSAEIEVRVTKDNVSVMPAMCNQLMEVVQSTQTTNLHLTLIETANNSIIGNNGLVVNQGGNDSDETKLLDRLAETSSAAQDVVKRYVEAFGEISDFIIYCKPDIREIKVQCTIRKEEPNSTLRDTLQKQIAKALNAEKRIFNIELIKHCIIISFDITGAKFPWEMSALTLAERFRSGVEDGSISLTDESGHALSICKDSTRIELKDTSDNADMPGPGVPLVSIGQSGYMMTAGGISVLKCTALSSVPVTSVRWFRINKEDRTKTAMIEIDNKKYFGGSTESPSLVINDTSDEDSGLYSCRAENTNGVGESPPVVLRIFENTQILQKLAESLEKPGSSSYDRQSETPLPETEEMDNAEQKSMSIRQDTMETKQKSMSARQDTMETEQKTISARQDTMEAKQKSMSARQDTMETEQKSISARQDTMETKQKYMSSRQDTMETEQKSMSAMQDTMEAEQKSMSARQDTIETEQKSVKARLDTVESQQKTMTANQESMTKEIHPDLKQMIETTINRIRTEKEKKFLETKAFHDAQDKLRMNRVLVIKGNTGDGKTSAAFQLLRWLTEEQQSRKPLQLHKIKKLDLLAPNSNLVCIIDDIFGQKDISKSDEGEWNKRLKHVETLFVDKQNHTNILLITIRNEIFNALTEQSLETIFTEENIVDLSSDKYQIKEEKQQLLEIYTPKIFSWDEEEITKILGCKLHIGFPQCCHLFCKSVELQKRRTDFFENPIKFFIDALSKLPECSAILFLFLNDGEIKVNDLEPNGDKVDKTLLEQAFRIKLVNSEERTKREYEEKVDFVRESLDKLLGFLVKKEKYGSREEVYRFHHDSIYVTVALLYGKKTPVGYIKYCRRKALSYLTTVKTSTDMVVISPGHYNDLCERLLREFESVLWSDTVIGSLDVWKDPVFVEMFDKYLNEKKANKVNILNEACSSGSAELALYQLKNGVKPDKHTDWWNMITRGRGFGEGDLDILKEIIVYLNDEMKQELLNKVCIHRSLECGMYLLSVGAKPDKHTDWLGLITRGRGSGKGDLGILKEIIVYLNDEMKQELLYRLCIHGSLECGMYLLSVGVKPDNDTVLHALMGGSVDPYNTLPQYYVTPTGRERFSRNALHFACESQRESIVAELCKDYPHLVHGTGWWGLTPLHVAAWTGNCSMFQTVEKTVLKCLCRAEDEKHRCLRVGDCLTHIDCACSQYMCQLVDDRGRTVLRLSCVCGHKDLCLYICRSYPAMTACRDRDGRHCLHYIARDTTDVDWFIECESCVRKHMETLKQKYNIKTILDGEGRSVLDLAKRRGTVNNPLYDHLVGVFSE